mmetsp:Transcript_28402/g.62437  ORF Transcript_28402/g.62437 Transcript_28402/m.62437 type:complete len:306 (+) Transcript_28402:1651-2568(+)
MQAKGREVEADGAGEEDGDLRDERHVGAQHCKRQLCDVDAVDLDGAALHLCQPEQAADHGALAGTCTPDNAHLVLGICLEADTPQHQGQARPVAHGHLPELHHPLMGPPGGSSHLTPLLLRGLLAGQVGVVRHPLHGIEVVLRDGRDPEADGHEAGELQGVAEHEAGTAGAPALLHRHQGSKQCGERTQSLQPHTQPPIHCGVGQVCDVVLVHQACVAGSEGGLHVKGADGGHPGYRLSEGREDGRARHRLQALDLAHRGLEVGVQPVEEQHDDHQGGQGKGRHHPHQQHSGQKLQCGAYGHGKV